MTDRDLFATTVLNALLTATGATRSDTPDELASDCYTIADAMLLARQQPSDIAAEEARQDALASEAATIPDDVRLELELMREERDIAISGLRIINTWSTVRPDGGFDALEINRIAACCERMLHKIKVVRS